MKRLLFTLLAVFSMTVVFAASGEPKSGTQPLFGDNLTQIEQQFADINVLEQAVLESDASFNDLAAQCHPALNAVQNDANISAALLGAGGQMDGTLKTILIVLGVLAVIGCGCFILLALAGSSSPQ